MNIKEVAANYKDYVIQMRREFHQIPEPSLKEYKTSEKIKEELEKMGIKAKTIADTGVVALIEGDHPGKMVMLRADIDALSVEEKTGVEYASKHPGMMHACGHDAHIAMNLGAAKILNDNKHLIKGKVKLIFQPSEENGRGARKMIDAGVMEGVDTAFGIHVWADLPAGKVSVQAGARMASADFFFIDIKGKGAHGSMPHQGVDAIAVGTAVVNNLQYIVSREINQLEPVVISVCEFKAGTLYNIIAGEATLTGTSRTYNQEIRNQLEASMNRVLQKTAETFRAEISLRYDRACSPVVNDSECSKIAEEAAIKAIGSDSAVFMEKTTGGEDFSEYQNFVPGVFAFLGISNEEKKAIYPQHSCFYNIDEDVLIDGSMLSVQYTLDYLNKNS